MYYDNNISESVLHFSRDASTLRWSFLHNASHKIIDVLLYTAAFGSLRLPIINLLLLFILY